MQCSLERCIAWYYGTGYRNKKGFGNRVCLDAGRIGAKVNGPLGREGEAGRGGAAGVVAECAGKRGIVQAPKSEQVSGVPSCVTG